jgi:hypothetical protein
MGLSSIHAQDFLRQGLQPLARSVNVNQVEGSCEANDNETTLPFDTSLKGLYKRKVRCGKPVRSSLTHTVRNE